MTWFSPSAPPTDLRDVVACRYVAEAAGHHDLLPDGCMDLVWAPGLGVVLCGPDTRAWSFEMAPGRSIAGVRFLPGAAAGCFAVPAGELLDRQVALADLLGQRSARQLDERLGEATTAADRLAVLDDFVRGRVGEAEPTVRMAHRLAADPALSVARLADTAGVSPRQLRRRFDRAVGYGPAFFARIVRLQRFAVGALRHPERTIADLAATAGYADQAHLARDARAITDRTPRQLVGVLGRSSVDPGGGDGRSVQDRRRPAA